MRKKRWLALVLSTALLGSSAPVYGAERFLDSPDSGYGAGDVTDGREDGRDVQELFLDDSTSESEIFGDSVSEDALEGESVHRNGNVPHRGQGNSPALQYAEGEAIVWMKENGGLLKGNFPYETEVLLNNSSPVTGAEELYASPAEDDGTAGTVLLVRDEGKSTDELIDELLAYPEIELAEPNYIVSLDSLDTPQAEEDTGLADVSGEEVLSFDGTEDIFSDQTAAEDLDVTEESLFSDSAQVMADTDNYDIYLDMSRGEWNKKNQGQMGGTPGADMNVEEVWAEYGTGSSDVVVAVVDTGIDYTHPDLESQMWTQGLNYSQLTALGGGAYGINCISGGDYRSTDPYDDHEHGTHCAGIVAASDDGAGTTGVAPGVKVMAVKVLNSSGSGQVSEAIRGLSYVLTAARAGVNVRAVNYSLGGPYMSPIETKIFSILGREGVVTCVASGNSSQDMDAYTLNSSSMNISPYVVVVNAMDASGESAFFSNYGKKYTNVYAPGCAVLSTIPQEKANFMAEFAKGNLLYTGFEAAGHDGTDTLPVGPELDFCRYEEGAVRGMGARLEPANSNRALGSRSVCVTGDFPEMISAPVHLTQIPSGECYLSIAAFCDNTYGFPIASLVDGNGREYYLENAGGKDENYYVEQGNWGNNDFVIPKEFTSWDDFQIKIKIEDYYQETSNYTCWIDCVGIGVQKLPYTYMTGTSMAAPAVTGEAALLASVYPGEGADVIAAAIRGGVTRTESLKGLCLEGGWANIGRAVENPYPVILKVENLGDTFLVYGQFSEKEISISVDGIQAEILDVCDSYLEVKVPDKFKESMAEIKITTAAGTGRCYWNLGQTESGYETLAISMGDKMAEEFRENSWMDMESGNGCLYLLGNPETQNEDKLQKIWTYKVSDGTWGTLPTPYGGDYRIYDICVYDSELYAAGITFVNGMEVTFVACRNNETGKWKAFVNSDIGLAGGLFTYQGRLYYGGGVVGGEVSGEIYVILPETGKAELADMELPEGMIAPRLEERGNELLFYGNNMFETAGIWHYDGTDWRKLLLPEEINREQDFQLAAEAVEDGYMITGLIKNPYDSSENFRDTWLLKVNGEEFSYEEYPEVFCPTKGACYVAEAYKNSFYVMAYVPQKGGFILKKLKGIETYAQVQAEKNGWQAKDGKTCYYEDGSAVTGFKKIGGITYYFYEGSGAASCSAKTKGEMVTGWLTLKKSGRTFYFWDGNKKTICNANAKGAMCTSWVTFSNKARFFFNNGNKKVKSNTSQRGQMATGWLTGSGGKKFYLWTGDKTVKCSAKKKGQMAVGWLTFRDNTKYFLWTGDKNFKSTATQRGQMVIGRMYDGKNKKYYKFKNNGKLY